MDIDFTFITKTLRNEETISRIMQYIKSQFTRRFSAQHNRTGPFWNKRFNNEIIDFLPEPEQSFFTLIRKIRNKKNRYSCWCSSAMMKCVDQKKTSKKKM